MPLKQNFPVLRAGMPAFQHAFAAVVQDHLPRGPAKSVNARVSRVLQDTRDHPWRRRHKAEGLADPLRQLDLFLPKPKLDLPRAAKFTEFIKNQANDALNLFIGVFFEPAVFTKNIALGDAGEIFASPRLLPDRFLRALPEHRQFDLAHGPFQPQNQPVVGMLRIVNAIMIDDQRIDDLAKLQQPVPVMAVPGKPGRLDGEDGAGLSLTHLGKKRLKPPALDAPAA